MPVRLLERVRGLHPRLRRDAADGDARPANAILLDEHHAGAELGGADGGRVAARPAPEDGDITLDHTTLPSFAFAVADATTGPFGRIRSNGRASRAWRTG